MKRRGSGKRMRDKESALPDAKGDKSTGEDLIQELAEVYITC